MLLGPNQRAASKAHPIDTLRRLDESDNDETAFHTDSARRRQQQQSEESNSRGQAATSESYGRILVSPPNHSPDNNNNNNHHNRHHLEQTGNLDAGGQSVASAANSNEQQSSSPARWPINKPQLTLGKQRKQLEQPISGEFDIQPNSSNNGNYAEDELSVQQHSGSVAATANNHAPLIAGVSGETGNEFEGTWHSGPIQQIEVRQTRADERNQNKQREIIHTTSNSREVFLVD